MGKPEPALSVGFHLGALHLGDEIQPIERYHRARDRLSSGIHDFSGNDAVVVQRYVNVPGQDHQRERERYRDEAMREQPANPPHPFAAPEVRPRMKSFWAMRKMTTPGASTMTTKA